MAYIRPGLKEIIDRKISEIDSRIPDAVSRLRRSVLNALARASAAVAHGLYGYINWISTQIIPDSADTDILERHASWWNVKRKAASVAVGSVDVVGTGTIPAGTLLQRVDEVEFNVDVETMITGSGSVAVTAVIAGDNGNTEASIPLSLVSAIAGINSTVIVNSSGLTAGADIESDDSLRQRLRERVQQPPHGGAQHDYLAWTKEVSGVTRAWVFPLWTGAGTVAVFFVRDNDVSFIPDAQEVADVQAHIDILRPVTANVTVLAPVEISHDMTIKISPNDTATQNAITAELNDLFKREATVDDGSGSGTVLISHVREAISIASGEYDNDLVVPITDITISLGEISVVGIITWQSI